MEVPEQVLSLPVHHVRFHVFQVLWKALSHLQSRTGSYNDAYNAWLFHFHLIHQPSVLLISGASVVYVTDLCLSSCKHRRTMYSRNKINFCCKRTDLCRSHVHPDVCDLLRSSYELSSSDTDIQPHQESAKPIFFLRKCFC